MGIYSRNTTEELQVIRTRLSASLIDRLAAPTSVSHNGGSTSRSAQFAQLPEEIRKELRAVDAELDRRSGTAPRGPIYMVG